MIKKILLITCLILTIVPLNLSYCRAQNMTVESLLNKADGTQYYGMERCPYCDKLFQSTDPYELEFMLIDHIQEHFDEWNSYDDGSNNDFPIPDNNGNGTSSGSNSGGITPIISMEYAATLAQQIGIDSKQNFIDDYYLFGNGYFTEGYVTMNNFTDFIRYVYGATLETNYLPNYHTSPFMGQEEIFAFYKQYSFGHLCLYSIHTRANYNNHTHQYEYIYVFR